MLLDSKRLWGAVEVPFKSPASSMEANGGAAAGAGPPILGREVSAPGCAARSMLPPARGENYSRIVSNIDNSLGGSSYDRGLLGRAFLHNRAALGTGVNTLAACKDTNASGPVSLRYWLALRGLWVPHRSRPPMVKKEKRPLHRLQAVSCPYPHCLQCWAPHCHLAHCTCLQTHWQGPIEV